MFNHGKCDINEACIAALLLLEKVCLIFLAVFASHKLYGSYVHAFISG
jgi:hypothetical protein